MIKIDLITGFLGSGKTTFIRRYASRLLARGQRLGILENDYGAVNVDTMLLSDLESERCGLESVSGACDLDCHRRRFKTKLIALGMSGYDRVLIEPSGIFDIDEFFDALYDAPLDRWYEIGSVIAIVDANLDDALSDNSEFLLASQIANAGAVVLSKVQNADDEQIDRTIAHLNRAMERFGCARRFDRGSVICKPWDALTDAELDGITESGYVAADYVKALTSHDGAYQSLYFLNSRIRREALLRAIDAIMSDRAAYGEVFRVKGFLREDGRWLEINATRQATAVQELDRGQEIIIVIGEQLNEENIKKLLQI